mgnify:CR=1 FL=1
MSDRFFSLADIPIYITTNDDAAFGYYSTELKCFCHLVRKDGKGERYTGPLGGELQPRDEPFPDEPVGW